MKNTMISVLLAFALIISLTACGMSGADNGAGSEAQAQPQVPAEAESAPADETRTEAGNQSGGSITPEEVYSLIQNGAAAQLVDVRRADEYEAGHIPGAILLPNEEIGETMPGLLPLSDTKLIVYCRTGVRSAEAAAKLVALGYTDVSDMGGINSWPYEKEDAAWTAPAEKAKTLSSFYTNDLYGNVIDEGIFEGHKLTMLNIWATFCGPCLREMPELGQLAVEYADKGVQIAGIVVDVTDSQGGFSPAQIELARDLVRETGANYIHLLPSADLVHAKLKEVYAVPETIFVDGEGNIIGESYVGSMSGEDWAAVIDGLLEKTAEG